MSVKKIMVNVFVVAIIVAIGITSYATTLETINTKSADITYTAPEDSMKTKNKFKTPVLTDNQKREMKEKFDKINKKWDALTNNQKEEIYLLNEKATKVDSQIVDKYLEYGVIDRETGKVMKERLLEKNRKMREDGRMPIFRGKCGGYPKEHNKFKPNF